MSAAGSGIAVRTAEVLGVGAVTIYVLGVWWAAQADGYATWRALVVVPLLVLLTVHLVLWVSRAESDHRAFARLLLLALLVKALGTVARYWMSFGLYNGVADATSYDANGARLAEHYRQGDFGADIGRGFIGTGFIRVLTGAVYTVTGPSIYVAYAVFSLLSFWGLYFCYRAFTVAVPDGSHRRYAKLIFFLPSMFFWPSGLGKEAWMVFGIGLAALGAARLLRHHRHAVLPLIAGLAATAVVRPHITAALFGGIAAALVIWRPHRRPSTLTPLARGVVVAVVVVLGMVLVNRAAMFLGVDDVTVSNLQGAINHVESQTSQGGSEFEASEVKSPLDLPWATVTVLFRPFIFEVDSMQTTLTAAEGSFVLLLLAFSVPRFRGLHRRLLHQPYLMLCLVYILLFVYGFSNIANFGILARERVQVLPFVLALLCLPRPTRPSEWIRRRPALERTSR